MKIKALVSFAGAFSMHKGEVKECSDKATLQDLLKAGYIEKVKVQKQEANMGEPEKGVKSDANN
ncbi:hypothetical protein [Desulfosporosinus nitroreducens]|uniref:hypothetical protein n=1 Tax=Desulfosporosinus nitroreducens TaxID=2018668 RepID=UPI00207C9CB7|nr:hypothetical protein [Desulfosporosinus nitroreducens]MCO1599831.1 hypothetical protein [Desulfosporosinus nitroreducens]